MSKPVVYVVIYSTWGHIKTMAEAVMKGLNEAGNVTASLYQVAETLPEGVLEKMHAARFPDIPVLDPKDLTNADAFLFGIPTRYGHGGQETTIYTFLPHLVHHGMIFVPLGYQSKVLFDNSEVIGGSPWGAGTVANGDGSRQPSAKELEIAETQGKTFAATVARAHANRV
ncbi:hypothetical protein HDU89_007696 [Geranomyces variabilis]|nr:hypothetical protein HDU89_007696 [Geranomyces variabilis]